MFKYAALRLAEHTLIISRSQIVPDKPIINHTMTLLKQRHEQPICEVHVGLLSSRFIKDSGANRLVAPIVTFRLQPRSDKGNNMGQMDPQSIMGNNPKDPKEEAHSVAKEFELVPLSPMSDKFLSLMLSYAKGIFSSVGHLKRHIIKSSFVDKHSPADTPESSFEGSNFHDSQAAHRMNIFKRATFVTGTELFFCNLKDEFVSPDGQEDDIYLVKEKQLNKSDHHHYKIKDSLGHSLRLELSFAYIDFPRNISIKINGLPPLIDNPFRSII